ncbi:hypothetical protein B0F90DRAFT_1632621, partial [Multifurca ochricompacta]
EIDKCVTLLEHNLSSFPRSYPLRPRWLADLATARYTRYNLSDQKEDLDRHILHLTELILLPYPSRFGLHVNIVDVFHRLADALFSRYHRYHQKSNRTEDIESSIKYHRFSRELPLEAFGIPINDVTETLVLALGSYARSGNGNALQSIEEMLALCRELLASRDSEYYPTNPLVVLSISVATEYSRSQNVDPLDRVIEFLREAVMACPPGLPQIPLSLVRVLNVRIALAANCGADLEEALTLLTRVETSRSWHCATGLGNWCKKKFLITGDMTDLEESINYYRMALSSFPVDKRSASSSCLVLGELLLRAFDRSNGVEYLEESISIHRRILEMQASRDTCFQALGRLSLCLFFRWLLFSLAQDLDESMDLFSTAVSDQYATVYDRLEIACKWASGSRVSGHHSTMSAYQNAMSLLQNCLVFAPTIETQHHRLVATRWMSRIPLEYASYLISVGRVEQAIEALEQGRALLWSEMRGLRTSIDQLREKKPELALRFAKVNQDLEALTTSISRSQSETVEVGEGAKDGEWFDAFGRTLNEQRKLLEERDGLISRIQELPGLQDFSKTLSYDALRDAASRGPVIIINHCKWRSDILILLHNSPPSFVPTPDDFYARATKLKDNLLETRNKYSPGSRKYDDALRSTLNDLYTLVGRPVIEKLRELKVPDQSRVWWCPTSVFCSLPLHAMGPIPSDDGVEQYFSDIYVSSYTPTLSALIQSRGPKVPTSDDPSLLLVGRPNDGLPAVWKEINAIRTHLGQSAHCLVNEDATLEAVKEGLQRHRFAHFAWDDRLTLLDIVRSHLPDAEFAFLSVCHAAELTDESIADEALHLAAAMQYCGFRSVVGTMWAVADDDGPELAKHFYRSMFGGEKAHSYKRSARSLRNAVQKLRRKREMKLERWVNFVHYGA